MDYQQQLTQLIEQQTDPELQLRLSALAPLLLATAEALGQYHFYVPTSTAGDWVVTTYRREDESKRVLEVFSRRQMASDRCQSATETVTAIGAIELILSLLVEDLDSVVAYRSDDNTGRELTKAGLIARIQAFTNQSSGLFA
ncbi:hypothetical protein [Synechococcus elongatus]|uniref:hypothetical protein n=1 Tax=Synechococcus elongatus TaxID=32046 RepID=UPI000F7E104B|nr:hypothetical protein [Synechococcus elongatus]